MVTSETVSFYEAGMRQCVFGLQRTSASLVSLIWICEYLDENFGSLLLFVLVMIMFPVLLWCSYNAKHRNQTYVSISWFLFLLPAWHDVLALQGLQCLVSGHAVVICSSGHPVVSFYCPQGPCQA